nr:hypothetical protein [Tanacetum cinerariifolium]
WLAAWCGGSVMRGWQCGGVVVVAAGVMVSAAIGKMGRNLEFAEKFSPEKSPAAAAGGWPELATTAAAAGKAPAVVVVPAVVAGVSGGGCSGGADCWWG